MAATTGTTNGTPSGTPAATPAALAQDAATELARLLPSSVPLVPVPFDAAHAPGPDAVAVRASFVGASSADLVVVADAAVAEVLAADDAVSLADALRPALEAAAAVLGPGVLDATVAGPLGAGLVEPGVAAVRNALTFRPPDVFVVALGTNDVGEKPPEEIMADVAQIVALVPADAPLVWVDTWVHAEQRASHYANLAIRQALAGRPGTTIVDWWSHGYDEGVIAGDGIHLQEAGKTLFAELIAEAVEPLVGA